jgi:hypothetical protein
MSNFPKICNIQTDNCIINHRGEGQWHSIYPIFANIGFSLRPEEMGLRSVSGNSPALSVTIPPVISSNKSPIDTPERKKNMKIFPIAMLTFATVTLSQAGPGDPDIDIDSTFRRPTITAHRATEGIRIDGVLNEAGWLHSPESYFTQKNPTEGARPSFATDVWVLYDDEAVYIGAKLHDPHPDSIVSRIGRRDADLDGDWFYVGIDSYHDRRTGFFFGVYASGSVTDGTLFNDEWDDDSWDGVWEAATSIDPGGWTAEMKIPYSQLRFPKQDSYTWGINFARQIERLKEENYFVMVPKKESGWVSRFADLTGIMDITPPTRVELLPYVVSGMRRTSDFTEGDPFHDGSSFTGNLGADLKLGLGSNMTFNATINPDFGQVEVDPAVVNLSQFETFYDEKRPFFVEGSNLFEFGHGGANSNWGFNSGTPTFFYSRRIGRSPGGSTQHDGFQDYPDATSILGAAKLTGKIAENWSIATLSALTEREVATVQTVDGRRYDDVVEPLASYNIIRSQKEFDNGRQGLGFLGTGIVRNLGESYLPDQFNRSGLAAGIDGWTNIDPGRLFVVTGWTAVSRISGTAGRMVDIQRSSLHYYQRPDVDHVTLDSTRTSLSGYAGRVAINKQRGNFKFNTALGWVSPGFDVNDMGFLFRTDQVNMHVVLGYRWYEPDGFFRSKGFNTATFRNYDFGGNKIDEGYMTFFDATFMNYWGVSGNLSFNPATLDRNGTRGGPMMMNTNRYGVYLEGWTDGRAAVSYNLGVQPGRSESGGYRLSVYPGVTVKPSPGVQVRVSPGFTRDVTIAQWVANREDPTAAATYGGRYVFGKIDQRELSASVRVDWTFTPTLSLQLYLQPLLSVGTYSEFKELKEPRTYTFNRYGEDNGSTISYDAATEEYTVDPDGGGAADPFTFSNPDFNYKSLRGNAVLRWEFLPGSTAFFVWTHSNYNEEHPGTFDFGRDLGNLFDNKNYDDAFLIKIAYWLHP